jgi:hypothetical protein
VNCACTVADDPCAGLIFELVVSDCRRVANRLKPAHGQTLRGHFYFVVDQMPPGGRERCAYAGSWEEKKTSIIVENSSSLIFLVLLDRLVGR